MGETPARPVIGPISVTVPVSRAVDWTGRVLFKPFDGSKWFVLGFCAWLAWIGQGVSGGGSNWGTSADEAEAGLERASEWAWGHGALFISLALIALVLVVGLVLLLTWLSSRGKLMFLDGVVRNRGAVVEPWRRFREQGNSLFGFRVVVGLIAILVLGALATLMVLNLTLVGIEGELGWGVLFVIGLWAAVLLAVAFTFALVGLAVNDIVVPIMWLRGCRVMEAWSEFRALLQAHAGTFALYVLMKILLGIGIVMITCAATCLTCCIAALPYIGTVLLLPLFVFRRSYSLYFLSQLAPDYRSLAPVDAPAAPADPAPAGPSEDAPSPPGTPEP